MSLAFIAGALLAAAGALGVVLARAPVHNVLSLVVNFIGLSILYLTLQAEFLAVVQVIIYAGAVLILFLFVIALLTVRREAPHGPGERLKGQRTAGYAAGGLVGVLLVAAGMELFGGSGQAPAPAEGFGGAKAFGLELLGPHLLAFEAAAFILLAAVIGVVVLVGRPKKGS